MRKINKHIVHCSDSTFGDAAVIDQWHRQRGWSGIGYHFVITREGVIELGRPLNKVGAHCKGHNTDSVGTCLIGKDEFTEKQFEALRKLDKMLKAMYEGLETFPHNAFSDKTCPNFNVKRVLEDG